MLTIAGGILLALAILYAGAAIWGLILLKVYEHRHPEPRHTKPRPPRRLGH